MIYAGILVLITNYYAPKVKDILYCSIMFLVLTVAAVIANFTLDANYMFINTPLVGAPTYIIVKIFSRYLYPVIVVLGQLILPFFIMFGIYALANKAKKYEKKRAVTDDNMMEEFNLEIKQ
jgi:uncharacterized membrane protein YwaF